MDSGYMKQIRKRILAAEDGTTFATSDFADIADSATVRQSLNRLVQAGILQRILRGIFVKPKFCSTLNEFVEVNPDAVAKTLARTYHCLPVNQIFTWNEVGHMPKGKYLLMHSMIYRTQLLLECNLTLPEHTFYVDNIFAFDPLPYVQNMYYLDTNFYRYFIGRDDQSVNETVMIRRIDQQLRVNKLMVNSYTSCGSMNKRTRAYMISYLDIITTISSIMLIRSGTKEALDKKKELLEYIRSTNRALYGKLRHSLMGNFMNLPGRGGRKVSVAAYKLCQKFYGFN